MRYVDARWNDFTREETYRIYIATSLKLAPQSKYLSKDYVDFNYVDFINSEDDDMTADEIVVDIVNRAGLKFK